MGEISAREEVLLIEVLRIFSFRERISEGIFNKNLTLLSILNTVESSFREKSLSLRRPTNI